MNNATGNLDFTDCWQQKNCGSKAKKVGGFFRAGWILGGNFWGLMSWGFFWGGKLVTCDLWGCLDFFLPQKKSPQVR